MKKVMFVLAVFFMVAIVTTSCCGEKCNTEVEVSDSTLVVNTQDSVKTLCDTITKDTILQ